MFTDFRMQCKKNGSQKNPSNIFENRIKFSTDRCLFQRNYRASYKSSSVVRGVYNFGEEGEIQEIFRKRFVKKVYFPWRF